MGAQPEEVTPEQIRERMADTRASLANNLGRLREEANPRALLTRRLSGARRKAHSVKEHAEDSGHAAAGKVTSPVRGVARLLHRQITDRPLLVGVAATLVGAATAMLVPGPRRR